MIGSNYPKGVVNFEAKIVVYSMWNDVRTYLQTAISSNERSILLIAIAYVKKLEED